MNLLWSHHEEGPEHHEGSQIQGKLEPAIASGQHREALLRQVVRSTSHHLLLDLLSLFSPADSGPGCFQLAKAAAPCCWREMAAGCSQERWEQQLLRTPSLPPPAQPSRPRRGALGWGFYLDALL